MSARFHPVRNTTLKDQVFTALRGAIFSGKLQLGEALRELHLARELGVSQPTIREALLELEKEGLVVRTRNVGTAVTNLSSTEVRDRLEVRLQLEGLAAAKAAQRMTEHDFRELNRRLDVLSNTIAENAYYESAHADLEFHRYVWQCSGNKLLARTLDQITAPLFAFISVLRSAGLEDLSEVVNSHAPIVEALQAGNPAALSEAVRKHIGNSYEPFLSSGAEDCRTYAERRLQFRGQLADPSAT